MSPEQQRAFTAGEPLMPLFHLRAQPQIHSAEWIRGQSVLSKWQAPNYPASYCSHYKLRTFRFISLPFVLNKSTPQNSINFKPTVNIYFSQPNKDEDCGFIQDHSHLHASFSLAMLLLHQQVWSSNVRRNIHPPLRSSRRYPTLKHKENRKEVDLCISVPKVLCSSFVRLNSELPFTRGAHGDVV